MQSAIWHFMRNVLPSAHGGPETTSRMPGSKWDGMRRMPYQNFSGRVKIILSLPSREISYWYACTKFGKLIFRVAVRCYILKLKCMKFDSGWGSTPDPAGGACNVPPDPLAGYKRASKGREVGEEGHFSPALRTLHKCSVIAPNVHSTTKVASRIVKCKKRWEGLNLNMNKLLHLISSVEIIMYLVQQQEITHVNRSEYIDCC